MSVSVCTCGATTYGLTDPDGRQLALDTTDHPTGIWQPQSDGRTCRPLTTRELAAGRRGHRQHQCPPADQLQPTLFEAGG